MSDEIPNPSITTALPTADQLEQAGNVSVFTESGDEVPLGSLIDNGKGGKAVVIFCQDFISYLGAKVTPEVLEEHRVKLSIVGFGDWRLIKPYRETLKIPFPIYSDPSKETYTALGMTTRTLDIGEVRPEYQQGGTLGVVLSSIWRTFQIGSIGMNSGELRLLGGDFIFEDGQPIYTHRMKNTRDHSPVSKLLEAAGLPYEQ
ncbi:hypothetical protein JCM16303_002088 [Sporobolomyces ruberrimus]